jgi:hypothetical protein
MSLPFSFPSFPLETAVGTYFEYLRTYSQELGSRIVKMYPPVQGPNDPIAKQVATLLRKPLPAQALTISGLAKALQTSRSVRIVGECGTGKTLMSMGVAHTHANSAPYSAIAMCPRDLRRSTARFSWPESIGFRPLLAWRGGKVHSEETTVVMERQFFAGGVRACDALALHIGQKLAR